MRVDEKNQQQTQRQTYIRSIINFLQGVAFAIFVFAVLLIIYLLIVYCTRLTPITNYAIVFDAGSSHTEMFVYHWPADKSEGLGTTSNVNEYFVCSLASVTPSNQGHKHESGKLKAISDFENHADDLEHYFRPCLSKAIEKIPQDRHKFSLIFLGATAGMRLALLRNATKAQHILETIREIFSNSPFQFVIKRQVRILTGIEEAIDGWITTNKLSGNFMRQKSQKKSTEHIHSENDTTSHMVGVLDLGGASTQVTFTDENYIDSEPIPGPFTTNISLFESVYKPYAHSYLCWGKNEALKRHRARLLNAALRSKRSYVSNTKHVLIRDPCLVRGTNDTLTLSQVFRSPCTEDEKERFNHRTNKTTFKFIGIGNATQCRQNIINLFDAKRNDKTVRCSYKQEYCTFDHAFQPSIPKHINFIGLSGYYYVFNNLAHGLSKPEGSTTERYQLKDFSLEEISRRLINVCETDYATLYYQEAMSPQNEQHKRGLCFDAWYMWLLLTYGIGFNNSDLQRLSFANTLPTGKVGWTLGYMINQTNYIPAEFREQPITKPVFIAGLTSSLIISLLLLAFLIVTCYLYCKPKSSRNVSTHDGYSQPNEQASV